jgi:hypothetical protein
MCSSGSRTPGLYGLQMLHKEGVPLRPIVVNIRHSTYQLSKYLAGLNSQLTRNTAKLIKNSFQFIQKLESLENDQKI